MTPFSIEGPFLGKASLCEPVLRALPDWFGVEEAIVEYVGEIERRPTFLAFQEGSVMGFLTVKQHNLYAAEILVMGIKPEAHRLGMGRALVERAEAWLREQGVEYFQVKTLADTHPDPGYARTRQFYLGMGFRPLEIFPDYWDKDNPCLMMIKKL
ncbi:MAG TPA: GNAT family N-acetyltransferase [Anaerolineaceae bacterium]|nr:GNAT family N-acetyltransferase [Anaerolineaceae bacterium]HPN50258.1 GNAT family N-acetyltransferase [Anaerolineaceae bacterium]